MKPSLARGGVDIRVSFNADPQAMQAFHAAGADATVRDKNGLDLIGIAMRTEHEPAVNMARALWVTDMLDEALPVKRRKQKQTGLRF